VKITAFGLSSLQPDGARLSVMERAAMSSLPDASEALLDPFAVPPPSSGSAGAPSAKKDPTGTMLIDLEYDPEAVADTAMDVGEPDDLATRQEPAVERGGRARSDRPLDPGGQEAPRSAPGKRTPQEAPLTQTGVIFGTPQYMAQELTSGTKNATRASDVFSLGIIAFEVLTGKRPFPEAPVAAKLNGRPLPQPVPFRTMCPTLPQDLAALLDRAMSHDARSRPSAKELAAALRATADKLSA
jgi:serine/threonine protein kinase